MGVVIGLLVFIEAETLKSRLLLGSAMDILFLLPVLWHHRIASLISFLGWMGLGIGGLIFFKWRKAGG